MNGVQIHAHLTRKQSLTFLTEFGEAEGSRPLQVNIVGEGEGTEALELVSREELVGSAALI